MKATIKTQVCTKCGLEKPLSDYSFRKDSNSYRSQCKDCRAKDAKAYRQAKPERCVLASMKATVIETQVCKKCRLEKPLSEFYFRKDSNSYRRDCKDCRAKYNKTYHKAYQKANPEKTRAKANAWRKANLERYRANRKAWRKANRERERNTQQNWERANREKRRAYCARRRAAKLQATPAWADLREIQDFYEACPPGYHIDHIFPLISPIMCGLHVRSNLQYLPAKENISKGNRVNLEQQLNG